MSTKRRIIHWHLVELGVLVDKEVIAIDDEENILQGFLTEKDGNIRCINESEFMDNVMAYITADHLARSFKLPVPAI